MTYSELLLTDEWRSKRVGIISRDENRCQKCLNKTYFDQFDLSVFRVKPTKDGSVILINSTGIHEIFYRRKITDFAKFKGRPTNSLAVLFKEVDYHLKIVAICSVNKNILQNELDAEQDFLIESELIDSKQESRAATRTYLEAFPRDSNLLKANALKRHLNSDDVCLSEIRWLDVKNLHVHHKYYQFGNLPWQYPDEALVTLCWSCHEALHREEKVPCLDENGNPISLLTPCSRCYGAGWFPEYNHVQNGVCFECNGAKYEEFI